MLRGTIGLRGMRSAKGWMYDSVLDATPVNA